MSSLPPTSTQFLGSSYNIPEEEDRKKVYLQDNFSVISDVVNDRKIGSYTQAVPSYSGQRWSYKDTRVLRTGYQTIAYIPSYPNSGVLVLTLTSDPKYPIVDVGTGFVITMLYGTASKPPSAVGAGDGDFFQFNNQGDTRISFVMTDISITITTTVDLRAYSGFIVIEYLRNGT